MVINYWRSCEGRRRSSRVGRRRRVGAVASCVMVNISLSTGSEQDRMGESHFCKVSITGRRPTIRTNLSISSVCHLSDVLRETNHSDNT